jgi:hypothetical protein
MSTHAIHPLPLPGKALRQWLNDAAPKLRAVLHVLRDVLLGISKARLLHQPGPRRAPRRL